MRPAVTGALAHCGDLVRRSDRSVVVAKRCCRDARPPNRRRGGGANDVEVPLATSERERGGSELRATVSGGRPPAAYGSLRATVAAPKFRARTQIVSVHVRRNPGFLDPALAESSLQIALCGALFVVALTNIPMLDKPDVHDERMDRVRMPPTPSAAASSYPSPRRCSAVAEDGAAAGGGAVG